MSEQLILEKLDNLEKQSTRLDQKVDKIEVTVGLIAVQSERINNMQGQIRELWGKHDKTFGLDGEMTKAIQFQASCPRDQIKEDMKNQWKTINLQWVAFGFLATMVTGLLLKIFNVIGGPVV